MAVRDCALDAADDIRLITFVMVSLVCTIVIAVDGIAPLIRKYGWQRVSPSEMTGRSTRGKEAVVTLFDESQGSTSTGTQQIASETQKTAPQQKETKKSSDGKKDGRSKEKA
ncbi:hypothetical protein Q1695_002575 [Nippostrongylus brasiliensis]|nr:hypothetical protein Q1695_002575 [Nippostrongylus brasiliensis]